MRRRDNQSGLRPQPRCSHRPEEYAELSPNDGSLNALRAGVQWRLSNGQQISNRRRGELEIQTEWVASLDTAISEAPSLSELPFWVIITLK